MRSVCAWCKAELGMTDDGGDPADITHGICEKCVKEFISEDRQPMDKFLDSLGVPVVMVDHSMKVRTANSPARELLGKKLMELGNRFPGDVIECVHSHAPGGCGSTLHCKSCVIRNTVKETFATGKSFKSVPAYPDIEMYSKVKPMCFRISTKKVGGYVLLRIDEVKEIDNKP